MAWKISYKTALTQKHGRKEIGKDVHCILKLIWYNPVRNIKNLVWLCTTQFPISAAAIE